MKDYKLNCVQAEGQRFYQSPVQGYWYPSVTTVVGHEKAEFWAEWRRDPKNAEISRQACSNGTQYHTIMEDYLIHGKVPTGLEDREKFETTKPYLDRITKVHAVETGLFSDKIRMAGRVDCVADFDGKISIIDFKTSRKPKTIDMIENYFHQTAAYAFMWEELGGGPVDRAVIIMLCGDGTIKDFVVETKEYRKGLIRVAKSYWNKYDFKKIQEVANGVFKESLQSQA